MSVGVVEARVIIDVYMERNALRSRMKRLKGLRVCIQETT